MLTSVAYSLLWVVVHTLSVSLFWRKKVSVICSLEIYLLSKQLTDWAHYVQNCLRETVKAVCQGWFCISCYWLIFHGLSKSAVWYNFIASSYHALVNFYYHGFKISLRSWYFHEANFTSFSLLWKNSGTFIIEYYVMLYASKAGFILAAIGSFFYGLSKSVV